MSSVELPVPVQKFLQENIQSIEQLEILLLLRGDAARRWSSAEINQIIRSSESSVSQTLEGLLRQGMLGKTDAPVPLYHFDPHSASLRDLISTLAQLYQERRVRIVQAIYSPRVSEMDEFARAFKLRKDSNG